ncbi:hypothetical protein DW201_00815 [Enterococcus casseliflavus]|nr:hypothetical protein DW201_00815 [Enterococcus casseliflavus]
MINGFVREKIFNLGFLVFFTGKTALLQLRKMAERQEISAVAALGLPKEKAKRNSYRLVIRPIDKQKWSG